MDNERDYKTINVGLEEWGFLASASAVTGETMRYLAEEAIRQYIRSNKGLKERVAAYEALVIERSKD